MYGEVGVHMLTADEQVTSDEQKTRASQSPLLQRKVCSGALFSVGCLQRAPFHFLFTLYLEHLLSTRHCCRCQVSWGKREPNLPFWT